jgi:hypothetical protein
MKIKNATTKAELKVVELKLIKLNLGQLKQEGFEQANFKLTQFPWPIGSGIVSEISIPMVLNYVPGALRGKFMDEVYRTLAPEGKAIVSVPYWSSMRSIQDYACEWPPFCEASFMYFNRDWRKLNHPDRDLKCNFDFTYGYQADTETASKNEETRAFYVKHYTNSVLDLTVVLTKKS